ncbi:MAG: zf-HC2 domain-containing protein [Gammaproteobacteria bacterium]|nr:zf-HC2 domain-containing protein [Gammaproteobacteria bacterium]
MLKCREVVIYADHLLAGELSVVERAKLHLHLAICRHCRRYVRQLRVLIGALQRLGARASSDVAAAVMRAIHARAGTSRS